MEGENLHCHELSFNNSHNLDKLGQMMQDSRKYVIRSHSTAVESDPSFRKMARELVVCPAENSDWTVVYVNSAVVDQLRGGLMKIERERERDPVTLSYQPTASALIAREALNR
jgi:hypothetical protein